jgi:hypothetical protein
MLQGKLAKKGLEDPPAEGFAAAHHSLAAAAASCYTSTKSITTTRRAHAARAGSRSPVSGHLVVTQCRCSRGQQSQRPKPADAATT